MSEGANNGGKPVSKTLMKMDSVQNLSEMMNVSAQFDMLAANGEMNGAPTIMLHMQK